MATYIKTIVKHQKAKIMCILYVCLSKATTRYLILCHSRAPCHCVLCSFWLHDIVIPRSEKMSFFYGSAHKPGPHPFLQTSSQISLCPDHLPHYPKRETGASFSTPSLPQLWNALVFYHAFPIRLLQTKD